MDLTGNYIKGVTAVVKEAQKLKKYKAMPLAFAIVVGVLMLPLAIAAIIFGVALYVIGYIYYVASSPTQKLHELLRNEGKELKHASQFIIYFLSWGFVFGAYALLFGFAVMLNILYTLFVILAYVATLGGFKFHAFVTEEDISVEVDGEYNLAVIIVYIAAMAVLIILLPLIKGIGIVADLPKGVATFKMFMQVWWGQIVAAGNLRFVFSAIYSAVVFAPLPKKKEAVAAEAE